MSQVTTALIKKDLRLQSNPQKAHLVARFFKTKKGEYGYGDKFLGISVPTIRMVARRYKNIDYQYIKELLTSSFHEERLLALIILVERFLHADTKTQEEIYSLYMEHIPYINNWDLVDVSADKIVGGYLFTRSQEILSELARSSVLWERRIAIIATFYFIKQGNYALTYHIATILLHDKHDLIHKAVGWMLREVGKRCGQEQEEKFLKQYYKEMPRTMLRYSLEHFSQERKEAYMQGKIA